MDPAIARAAIQNEKKERAHRACNSDLHGHAWPLRRDCPRHGDSGRFSPANLPGHRLATRYGRPDHHENESVQALDRLLDHAASWIARGDWGCQREILAGGKQAVADAIEVFKMLAPEQYREVRWRRSALKFFRAAGGKMTVIGLRMQLDMSADEIKAAFDDLYKHGATPEQAADLILNGDYDPRDADEGTA